MEVGDCSYSEVYFENLGDNATKDEDYSYNHDPVYHVAKTIFDGYSITTYAEGGASVDKDGKAEAHGEIGYESDDGSHLDMFV